MNRLLGPEVTWTNIKPVSTTEARDNLLGFLAIKAAGKMEPHSVRNAARRTGYQPGVEAMQMALRNKAILRQAAEGVDPGRICARFQISYHVYLNILRQADAEWEV